MGLTDREQEIVDLLRREPLISPARIAERIGSTRAAVNVHLSNLGRKGVILGRGYILVERPPVVVVGGANLDIKARSAAPAIPGTSNPGHTSTTPGGVARNIAENLARLGTPTQLIAAIGRDPQGERLLADTREAGVLLDYVHRAATHPTGSYTALLDADGELLLAVADMTATDALAPEHLRPVRDLVTHAALLVLDGNLPAATSAHLLDLAAGASVRVVIDPVSVPKAARLVPVLGPERPIFAITPNCDELHALTGLDTADEGKLGAAASVLHDRGAEHVWIRLGARGSMLSTRDGSGAEHGEHLAAHRAAVHDVTGAGDAMLGAFVHALLAGHSPAEAARYGHAAAALTLRSPYTVRPDLTERLLEDALAEHRSSAPEHAPAAAAAAEPEHAPAHEHAAAPAPARPRESR